MRQLTLVLFALVLVQSLCCGCTSSPTVPTEEAGRPILVTTPSPSGFGLCAPLALGVLLFNVEHYGLEEKN
jgi:hypothetical protein